MSVIVVGLSHASTPMETLERAALDPGRTEALARELIAGENVTEAVVVATCNRLEVYADAVTFHGAIDEIGSALVAATGLTKTSLHEHAYVHYEDRAVAHAFSVACGLESMAVGEPQILGQLRDALVRAQRLGTAGPHLNALVQQALRVGKRAHAETGLDRSGASLVAESLATAQERLGSLSEAHVLVVGAGSMSALVATTASRQGVGELTLVNRTHAKAVHLAQALGAKARPWPELTTLLGEADVVLTCTGALGHVLAADAVAAGRMRRGRDQVYVDLALPRDVDPAAEQVEGVHVVTLAGLGERLADRGTGVEAISEVRDLVTSEVAGFLVSRKMHEVGPTVAALRSRAAEVVSSEMARLDARLGDLDDTSRAEIHRTVHRVVEKLLHTPTVRIKELAGRDGGGDYAHALRELFDLDGRDVATVSSPPAGLTP